VSRPHATVPGAAALVEIAARACRGAGELLRSGRDPRSRDKSAYQEVTDADIAVERYLTERLRAAVTGSSVVGEELPPIRDGAVTWYVDPIDGTNNFSRGLPLACVSVGVTVGRDLVGGCVYDPYRDELFAGGPGMRLRVESDWPSRPRRPGAHPVVLTDLPRPGADRPDEADLFLRLLRRADVRRIGASALALAWVAAGRADAACNLAVHSWDLAAGAGLVRARGGTVVTLGGDEDDPIAGCTGFVAAGDPTSDLVDWLTGELRAMSGSTLGEDARL
jgi:myo-inositol-1(or 4)-monophosphatase